jgi:hypothetical protein
MAKKSRRRRSLRGFGNIISVRKGVDGLFDTGTVVGDALPVVLGGVAAVAVTMLVRRLAPSAGSAGTMLSKYAPGIGGLAGALAGLGLVYGMGKRTAGTTMMAASVTTGGVLMAHESMSGMSGFGGFGAIVPEYGMGAIMPQMNGLGATVLEEWPQGQRPDSIGSLGDAYGTAVNLSGLGAVNTSAFGTPGFQV